MPDWRRQKPKLHHPTFKRVKTSKHFGVKIGTVALWVR